MMVPIHRYIKLITPNPLSEQEAKQWYRTVKENGPEGNISSIQAPDRVVSMLHRQIDNKHEYVIGLFRDPTESESEAIVHAWNAYYPTGDIDIETSAIQPERGDIKATIEQPPDLRYLDLCLELAKIQHADWVRDRADAGWRYGTSVSIKNKTHPLMRPWEQLPAMYRKVDQKSPLRVLSLLNNRDYATVKREELDALIRLFATKRG